MVEEESTQVSAATVADIAALARKLVDKDPYKSASGPEALLAFADHLDGMLGDGDAGRMTPVRVKVRKKRGG